MSQDEKGRFLPGNKAWQNRNMAGRRELPDDLKGVQKYHAEHVDRLMCKMLDLTKSQLQLLLDDPSTSFLEAMIGAVMIKGVIKGEPVYLDFILKRVAPLPKEPATIDVEHEDFERLKAEVPIDDVIAYLKERRKA